MLVLEHNKSIVSMANQVVGGAKFYIFSRLRIELSLYHTEQKKLLLIVFKN